MSDSTETLVRAASRDQQALEALLVRHLPQLQGWLRLRMPWLRLCNREHG